MAILLARTVTIQTVMFNKLECWQLTCQFPTWQSPVWSSSQCHKWLIPNHPLHESLMSLSSVRVNLQLMESQNWLPWQRPLDPRSRVCLHWIAWPRKPTPRIKQWVASCHTAEVMSIQSLPAPPPTPRGQPISKMGGGTSTHHVWYGRAHIATIWRYCFRFPDFPRIRQWRGSKSRFWVPKSAKMGVFRP